MSSVEIAAFIEPSSRILRVKSRVSIPLIPGVSNSFKKSSKVFCDEKLETSLQTSLTTKPSA